jgi:Flp pilus assembly protein TadG
VKDLPPWASLRWTRVRSVAPLVERRGVAIIEFAIILPLLLLIVVGTMEFARALNIKQVVVNSAREGARIVALPPGSQSNETLVRDRVDDYLTSNGLDLSLRTVTIQGIDGAPGTVGEVTVAYQYTFDFFGGIASMFGGSDPGTVTLTSTSRMRNE